VPSATGAFLFLVSSKYWLRGNNEYHSLLHFVGLLRWGAKVSIFLLEKDNLMVDVSRRGFLTLLGLAGATAVTAKIHVALANPIISIVEPIVENQEVLDRAIADPIISDCFVTRQGIKYPIGRLLSFTLEERFGALPIRSGLHGEGIVIRPTTLNSNTSSTVKIQTVSTFNQLATIHDTMEGLGFKVLKSVGDVGFSVDSTLPNGDRYNFECDHACPDRVSWEKNLSDGSEEVRLDFGLLLCDQFRVNEMPRKRIGEV
jgi:hypothetical protein